MSSAGLSDAAGGLSAVGDLFGGIMGFEGDQAAASAYDQAAAYAQKNAAVAQRSGQIQEMQANRQVFQSIGGQQSDVAAAGMTSGGSNQYLMRSSIQQGGVTKALINNQATLQVQGYDAEAAADLGQAQQAQDQGDSSLGKGILGAVGAVLGFL